jgi:hypothetical protein
MNPPTPLIFSADASDVQSYLDTLQNIIARMATNSSNCKTWCITLVSAILVVIVDKKIPNYTLIAYIPVFLFLLLDAYYLAQEKAFREIYNTFVTNLHAGIATSQDLFMIRPLPGGDIAGALFQAIWSFSIWPFYAVIGSMVILARFLLP